MSWELYEALFGTGRSEMYPAWAKPDPSVDDFIERTPLCPSPFIGLCMYLPCLSCGYIDRETFGPSLREAALLHSMILWMLSFDGKGFASYGIDRSVAVLMRLHALLFMSLCFLYSR